MNDGNYNVVGNNVLMETPKTGLFTSVVLSKQTAPVYGLHWGRRKTAGSTYTMLVSGEIAAFAAVAGNLNRIIIFKDGVKLITGTLTSSTTDAVLSIVSGNLVVTFNARSNAGTWLANAYIEIFALGPNSYAGFPSYGKIVIGAATTGNLFALNVNPLNYVSMSRFYNNVLVFKNGLFMDPARTYFWLSPTQLNFKTALVSGDVVELYFLKETEKKSRIYAQPSSLTAASAVVNPEYPNTRFTRI